MANELDETTGPVNDQGRDARVIEKQVPVKVGAGTTVFEVLMWVLGIIPGIILLFCKIRARTHLQQLQQKIQAAASQIDNYLEQRVIVLENCAQLVTRAIKLDTEVLLGVAKFRSGNTSGDDNARNELGQQIEDASRNINVQLEAYPDIKAHAEIQDAMQQNSYLQREITAAREVYNDAVLNWNTQIWVWPCYQMVASKAGYTTRIPFSVSTETRERARGTFFGE